MWLPIAPDEKLAVTLRFLATGESYEGLQYHFRIHRMTIRRFVPLVCKAIYNCLKEKYLEMPRIEEEWKSVDPSLLAISEFRWSNRWRTYFSLSPKRQCLTIGVLKL